MPEITLDKNLFNSERYGNLDLQSNLKVHNYETNKLENFFINDFNWSSKDINSQLGFNTKVLGNLRNINYETKNVNLYKDDTTSEFFGALGLFSKLNLEKNINNSTQLLTPKVLLRLSPGSMRKDRYWF